MNASILIAKADQLLKSDRGVQYIVGMVPESSDPQIQSVLFARKIWSLGSAMKQAESMGYGIDKIEKRKKTWRFEQRPIEDFVMIQTVNSGSKVMEMIENKSLEKGDYKGHPFRGNQWTGGSVKTIQTNSPEFKEWFGDSKVVDKNGKPLVVFHGSTTEGVVELTPENAVEVGGAVFFTDNQDVAEQYRYQREYGEIVSEVYDEELDEYVEAPKGDMVKAFLRIENPMVVDFGGDVGGATRLAKLVREAKAAGHDGLIIKNVDDSVGSTGEIGTSYAIFDGKQVKSATGNKGKFNRNTTFIED